jgi:hypothetical protein
LSSEHAEKFDKFVTSPHVKYELQKQVWKGSEERHGKRREGSVEENKKKKREGGKRNGGKEKNKRKWEEIEAKKNKI